MENDALFREEQRFSNLFVGLACLGALLAVGGIIVAFLLIELPDKRIWWVVPALLGVEGLLIWLFSTCKLITEVTQSHVRVRLFPFQFKYKSIASSDIVRAYVRKYSPIMEYGGWGIRWSSNGRAYNMKGKIGMQLEMHKDKKVLIGTQKPDEFEKAMKILGKVS